MSRDDDLKEKLIKRADRANRFQEEEQHCCQQHGGHGGHTGHGGHGGHGMDSRDSQCKTQICKSVPQARCDIHCERAATKKCEGNNVATVQQRGQKATKMQEGGEERRECSCLIERDDAKGKRRATGVAGRICNNKESCQKNICKTWEQDGGSLSTLDFKKHISFN